MKKIAFGLLLALSFNAHSAITTPPKSNQNVTVTNTPTVNIGTMPNVNVRTGALFSSTNPAGATIFGMSPSANRKFLMIQNVDQTRSVRIAFGGGGTPLFRLPPNGVLIFDNFIPSNDVFVFPESGTLDANTINFIFD